MASGSSKVYCEPDLDRLAHFVKDSSEGWPCADKLGKLDELGLAIQDILEGISTSIFEVIGCTSSSRIRNAPVASG
jgi:hypothetical protein